MSNLFKESLKFITLKVEQKQSPLEYELPKQTQISDELKENGGILGYSKFEREER